MSDPKPKVLIAAGDYFHEVVDEACTRRNIKAAPLVQKYLVDILQHYVSSENFFEEDESGVRRQASRTELMLKALNENGSIQFETLKKLGDSSLYVAGFFTDSLARKTVDVEFYCQMGCLAYSSLSKTVEDTFFRKLYEEFSIRFIEFVDVFAFISQKAMIYDNNNLLRLYETYLKTGSELARDHLMERGLIPVSRHLKASGEQ